MVVRRRRARREQVLGQVVEGAVADGVYKGMNNYIDYTSVRSANNNWLWTCLPGPERTELCAPARRSAPSLHLTHHLA